MKCIQIENELKSELITILGAVWTQEVEQGQSQQRQTIHAFQDEIYKLILFKTLTRGSSPLRNRYSN